MAPPCNQQAAIVRTQVNRGVDMIVCFLGTVHVGTGMPPERLRGFLRRCFIRGLRLTLPGSHISPLTPTALATFL